MTGTTTPAVPAAGCGATGERGEDLTTDDHTCVLLLDDVLLRQFLATRDADDRAMLVRLNLASNGVPHFAGRLIGPGRPTVRPTAADRARRPGVGRHAALEQPASTSDREHSAAA